MASQVGPAYHSHGLSNMAGAFSTVWPSLHRALAGILEGVPQVRMGQDSNGLANNGKHGVKAFRSDLLPIRLLLRAQG